MWGWGLVLHQAGRGGCPGAAGWQLPAPGKEQLKSSRVQLVYLQARRPSREMITFYKHTGGKHRAGG